MKPAENIEKLIRKLRYKTSAETHERVLGNVLQTLDKSEKQQQCAPAQYIWRIFMKSPIKKLAAAAVIILGMLILLKQFGVPTNVTSNAFADALENMKKMPWVHVVTESETPTGKQICEEWTCFEPLLTASKSSKGNAVTVFTNYAENREYLYNPGDPDSNKISIIPIDPYSLELPETLKSPFDMIAIILERMKNQTSKKKSTIDGIDVEIIHSISAQDDTTIYRDIKRNLLIRMDKNITVKNESLTKTSKKSTSKVQIEYPDKDIYETGPSVETHKYKYLFDYPDEGPRDIYALGAPRDAEVDNYCPTGFLADIFAEVRQRINKSYEGYFAIVLESDVNDGNFEQQKITLMRPRDSNKFPFLWTGTIRSLSWFHPWELVLNWNTFDINYEMLPANPEHEELIGFKVLQIQKDTIKRTRTDEYWLDPKQDYLVIEHVRFESNMNRYWDSTQKTITLATKQTTDGQWYPSHVSYEWNYTDNTGQHKQQIDKQIIFKKEPVFPEDNFQVDYIFDVNSEIRFYSYKG